MPRADLLASNECNFCEPAVPVRRPDLETTYRQCKMEDACVLSFIGERKILDSTNTYPEFLTELDSATRK